MVFKLTRNNEIWVGNNTIWDQVIGNNTIWVGNNE